MTDERFQKHFNKPETVATLAAKYNVDPRTLRRWIKPIQDSLSPPPWRSIRPVDLKKILEFIGEYELKNRV